MGRVVNGEVVLTALGRLVAEEIRALPGHYPGYLLLDQWVVMPNHIHLILFFVRPIKQLNDPGADEAKQRIPNLSDVIRLFKAGVTYKARKAGLLGAGRELVAGPLPRTCHQA